MMADADAIFRRRLGRAEIEPAINLHGINGNNFAADFFGQREGETGFSDRRRTGEEEAATIQFRGRWMKFTVSHGRFVWPRIGLAKISRKERLRLRRDRK